MTRWARKAAAEGGKALPATPWEEMAAAPRGAVVPARKKRRKEYADRDVNGFAAHLRKAAGGGAAEGEEQQQQQEDEEEAAAAVRKALRREGRRLRRQEARRNAMVCFHCREPGHGVADCPAVLESQDMGTGICYRCGSTEHDISKCKAKIDPAAGAFPYAKCFICGEMGHLSRSCPDNPKGLYAEGGCCKLCGSVEHFRKDCPENKNLGGKTLHKSAWLMSSALLIKDMVLPESSLQIRLRLGDGPLE
ncbi:zinc finger CCHC domain-containing protein 9 isoform X1 [Anser cygnoides]|uniref:zinc finger CCHC domain-containing protein 9 isoform X1 n=1 Tax=Anser cygnoides TaxID=8845 RepID=UPI0034D1DCD8